MNAVLADPYSPVREALAKIEDTPPGRVYAARLGVCVAAKVRGQFVVFRRLPGDQGAIMAEFWPASTLRTCGRVSRYPLGPLLAERAARLIDRKP